MPSGQGRDANVEKKKKKKEKRKKKRDPLPPGGRVGMGQGEEL